MIEITNLPGALQRPAGNERPASGERQPQAREDGQGFSFAGVVSAMERHASASLKTHGGAPAETSLFAEKDASTAREQQARQPAQTRASDTAPNAAPRENAPASQGQSGAQVQTTGAQGAAQPLSPAPTAIATTATPIIAAPAGGGPAALQGALTSAARPDAAGAKPGDGAPLKAPKAPTAHHAPAPEPATRDFAKLLARRLDQGATQFELRLDPPSLGKVEASLRIGDDGDNILALKFENQSTLDLFARDDAALRNAMAGAGFDFARDRMIFTLAQEDQSGDASESTDPASLSGAPLFADPLFEAPWTTGALDIRI